jgi:hypothetical protein
MVFLAYGLAWREARYACSGANQGFPRLQTCGLRPEFRYGDAKIDLRRKAFCFILYAFAFALALTFTFVAFIMNAFRVPSCLARLEKHRE